MTKKDYIAIAQVLRDAGDRPLVPHYKEPETRADVLLDVALMLADVLEQDNSKFSRERFLTACNCKW